MSRRGILLLVFLMVAVPIASAQQDQRRESEERPVPEFQPQNDRERALFEMIKELRSEVASLRTQLRSRERSLPSLRDREGSIIRRPAEGDAAREMSRRDSPRLDAQASALYRKAQRIYQAYDKNKDKRVSFEEWLAMREGEMTPERRIRERQYFADPAGEDEVITLDEFFRWMQRRARGAKREDAGERTGLPAREGTRDSSREGSRERSGLREREGDQRRSDQRESEASDR